MPESSFFSSLSPFYEEHFITHVFLIYAGAAVLATLALYARQTMIVAYIIVGMLLGPLGAGLIEDPERIKETSEIGITFLLFLLGLDLSPVKLLKLLRSMTIVTVVSCLLFGVFGFAFGLLWGANYLNALIIGAALMFSSTIIGLKLLPTTVLHHKPTGETIISILLLQDALAIVILLVLRFAGNEDVSQTMAFVPLLALPLLVGGIYLVQKYVIHRCFERFQGIREYLLLLAIGWSVGVAEIAEFIGLSREIGAFIAGIVLASNPIAPYIAQSLKPIRDFFLIIFFFSLGASVDFSTLTAVALPALVLALLTVSLKPFAFNFLLRASGQEKQRSMETGVRLGQGSEFSLLIAVLAWEVGLITTETSMLIQTFIVLTFLISPYLIVMRYPTPISPNEALRRD